MVGTGTWNMARNGTWNVVENGTWNMVENGTYGTWWEMEHGTWWEMEHIEHEADHVADVRVRTTGVPVTVLLTLECNVGTKKPGVSESSVVGQWRPI